MGKILELPIDIINKIAAGEVIERPSSVVKELIENSIDAGAQNIIIEVKEGGKSFIRIQDDGSGMFKEDAELAIKKHTTSKIKTAGDLFKIGSLGFRGEALASIASVSRMEIQTKTQLDTEGLELEIENGEIKNKKPVGVPIGTTIKIYDLFYNTPARKKYMKDIPVEFSHIADVVTKYALAYQGIGFRLVHNGKDVLFAPKTPDRLGNIVNIYGRELAKEMIPINKETEHIKIRGFIGKPTVNRADKSMIITFINHRYVKNHKINNAIVDAYANLLNTERYPVVILNFEIPKDKIDVNVHPTKIEVRIEKEDIVCFDIRDTIKTELETVSLVPKADPAKIIQPEAQSTLPQTDIRNLLRNKELIMKQMEQFKHRPVDTEPSKQKQLLDDKGEGVVITPLTVEDAAFNVIGRIHKTYILVETLKGLRVIDQHAAHERILFEEVIEKYSQKAVKTQELLTPVQLHLNVSEQTLVKNNKEKLREFGFTVDEMSGSSLILRTTPSILGKQQSPDLFMDLVAELNKEKDKKILQITEEILARVACRRAVKAGDILENMEMSTIVKRLMQCKQPHSCPHGRPTMIDFTIRDLEKSFNRIRGYETNA
ncbi:DNA mismatch repair endonuclease MutL [Candidatus Woesearchaeota archaeon]|nr:DNA mismatch repair endonuclease MutL [Candidatus Woesearchaeota archaeon]